jgi:tetratricopeptide (TPR) repeat protein
VAALDPDRDLGAIARTTLADLNATTLVPTTQVPCNPAAERAFADAEERFSAHAFSDAAALYRQAVEACPANATYRAWLGDAYFALGDLRTAKVHLEMAVEIDPCHAMAQRFLADMHLQQGNPRPAWRALTVAVACDPGYEPARTWLDGLVSELYGFPAELDRQLPPAEVTAGGGTVRDPRASADPTVFSPALADAFVAGLSAVPDADEPASSVLARNRAALEAALTVYGNLDARERPSSLFWPRMAAAQQHGCLDAALFAFLLTPRLVPAFLDARDHDRDALVRCMQDVLAPLPGQGILAD